jgi:hypothetical protein
MAEVKRAAGVSRAEFYSTAAMLFVLPAILFLAAGGFPETLLRQIAAGLVFVAMVGMSITYSILAVRERGRQTDEKGPGAAPDAAADRPRD